MVQLWAPAPPQPRPPQGCLGVASHHSAIAPPHARSPAAAHPKVGTRGRERLHSIATQYATSPWRCLCWMESVPSPNQPNSARAATATGSDDEWRNRDTLSNARTLARLGRTRTFDAADGVLDVDAAGGDHVRALRAQ